MSMIRRMKQLPNSLYRADQVRELDRRCIEEFGIAGAALMERAGQAAFDALRQRFPRSSRIAVFCGKGNNGGDGYVVARLAHQAGLKVRIYVTGDPDSLKGDALQMAQACNALEIPLANAAELGNLSDVDIVVDGLLGTGLQGAVHEEMAAIIEHINHSHKPVLALDIPSGLHADTGAVLGHAIRAALTVSFIGLKQGLFTAEGPHCCGEIMFHGLRAPAEVYLPVLPDAARITLSSLSNRLAKRPCNAHKGHFGHVLVIGGNHGFGGAARMTGEAAARVGAGLVSIATRKAHAHCLAADRPELMVHAVEAVDELKELLAKASVVAVGPGLGQDDWARQMLSVVLETRLPTVVDADALNLLAREPVKQDHWILTPHPGEAARLLGTTSQAIQSDRFAAVRELQTQYGGVVLLKGAGTLIWAGEEPIAVCDYANPGMASGGMGDILTGVIAGLRAQNLGDARHNLLAARLGACVHASAAEWAVAEGGERGLLATDLMPFLRDAANPD